MPHRSEDPFLNDSSSNDADLIASDAADAFAAAARGEDLTANVVKGLDYVLQITRHPGMLRMTKSALPRLEQAVIHAGLALAEQGECKFSTAHQVLGMAAALGAVSLFGKTKEEVTALATLPLVLDYVDHMSLLMAELTARSVAQRIELRGSVLRRALAEQSLSDYRHKPSATAH